MLQDNYLTENPLPTEKEEICSFKPQVKTLKIENKFLKNDVNNKQNLTDSFRELT